MESIVEWSLTTWSRLWCGQYEAGKPFRQRFLAAGEDTGMSEPRTIPIAIQSDQSPDPRPGSEL